MFTAQIIKFIPMDKLPNRLREHRKAAHLSQEELGERLGLTHTHISNLERGKRKMTLLLMEALARELDIAVVDLLSDEHNPHRLSPQETELLAASRQMDDRDRQRLNDIARTFVPEPAELPVKRSGAA